jgi:phosphohistidine phosphatase
MSEILVIRHADALPPVEQGTLADADRPLTERGQTQAQQLGQVLAKRGILPQRILTSPLRRAADTAEIIRDQYPAPAPEVNLCELLAPGEKRAKVTRFLRKIGLEQIAIVGHEPDLGRLIAWLIRGKKARVELTKAGAARVTFDGNIGKKSGTLTWLLPFDWIVPDGQELSHKSSAKGDKAL